MIDFSAYVKYSRPGPRYTSYPTAPEFSDKFSYEDYVNELKNRDKSRPLSLYLHLPFCRSACYFCGCNVIYTSKDDRKERYIGYLEKELEILSAHLDTSVPVLQMHFGGGTPTFYDATQLDRIIRLIKAKFQNFLPNAEVSCEIDPRFLNEAQLDVLVSHGFNRVSYGVQDFDEKVQKEIHRIQPYEITQNAVNLARKKGINSVNMDLIYGLPYQSLDSFKHTLELALTLDPDRLAIFNYAHVPWIKKSMRKFDETTLPSPQVKLEILKYTAEFLTKNGYKMIGMDHFAKPNDELFAALANGTLHRNFQGYTTKGGADLIGIGVTSIGECKRHYAQNFKDMDQYEAALDSGILPYAKGIYLSDEDLLRKTVIMSLMSNFALDIKAVEAEFGVKFFEHFKSELKQLEELKDFVKITPEKISVNETGTLIIRNIAMCFDEYLQKIPENLRRYSKTI
ncbi:oxygen-independent coproporphyrinogen III oxidase [Campylobacter curvus]|uniref:oxygen-independent coproporphyrinogen III oxidase n=1 Tax=Campylobacter curvus TaxID=200 RepID=UPI00037B1715|nr:oxygen-independent coproporphyrinogen III oxidase [Campylobacter curvus]QKF61643.1 oxygen-independent coproporphyrinogen III oxidase [Campylobacter curvus]UEB49944.1 oxygen-independent coproporphyrinogen III oxidase [Campylobacter curvus]